MKMFDQITKNILKTLHEQKYIKQSTNENPFTNIPKNATITKKEVINRTRNRSKIRNSSPMSILTPTTTIPEKTFAAVAADKSNKAETIRTIIIPADDVIKNQFLKDNVCAHLNITKINKKTQNVMTVKCATSDDASLLEGKITQKYRGVAKVNKVTINGPQIKITNLPTDIDDSELISMMIEQNHWISNEEITLHRSYIIDLNHRKYTNLIINCSLEAQQAILDHEVIIIGFQERRCFENVSTIQRLKCFSYGHMLPECNFRLSCRRCGEEHNSSKKDCNIDNEIRYPNCPNIQTIEPINRVNILTLNILPLMTVVK